MNLHLLRLAPWLLAAMLLSAACGPGDRAARLRGERLDPPFQELKRHARPLAAPIGEEWLAVHPEGGQSVAEYVRSSPARLAAPHDTIEVLPLGDFSAAQRRVLERTVDHLAIFFGHPVRTLADVPRKALPDSAFRHRKDLGHEQLATSYVLERVLPSRRSPTSFAIVAITTEDLYPRPNWNFVLGLASPSSRSGVWSMARLGDPEASREVETLCLLRTLKTASHEIAHTLSMPHCIGYQCLMNGSNSLEEADRKPAELCPPCLAKLTWSTGVDPAERGKRLEEFFVRTGVSDRGEANRYPIDRLRPRER